jgi:hypothetical protein
MANHEEPSAGGPYEKDGHAWRIGTQDDVSWIQQGLTPGTAITTAIPPEFEAYATIADRTLSPGPKPAELTMAGAVSNTKAEGVRLTCRRGGQAGRRSAIEGRRRYGGRVSLRR